MSRFYLVRHAKAEKQAKGTDALRTLTAEGRNAFAAHVHHHARDLKVTRILTSPYLRARETADVLAGATGAPVEEDEALASGTSSGRDLLRLGAKLGAGVALVGHNPEIAQAVALAADREVDVKPGTVVAVDAEDGGFRVAWVRPVS